MGEGGAPADATNHLNLLHTDYRKLAETLMAMGLNGAMFDIELPVVSKDIIPEGNKAKIHNINNRPINKAGDCKNWLRHCKCTSGTGSSKADCSVGCEGKVECRIEEEE